MRRKYVVLYIDIDEDIFENIVIDSDFSQKYCFHIDVDKEIPKHIIDMILI